MNLKIDMSVRQWFFDRQKVADKMERANRRALSRAGAFIRRRARSLLRRRKRVSRPGEPPSVHSQDKTATLKNILFAYEPQNESLVVGPVLLNRRSRSWITLGSVTVPQLLEHGDVAQVQEFSLDGGKTWLRADKRSRLLKHARRGRMTTRRRRAAYQPRPFMGPALDRERDNIPSAWQGTLGQ